MSQPCAATAPPLTSPPRSFVDVAYAASHVSGRPGEVHRRLSLRSLCSRLLNVQLDKSQQMSPWGQRPLTEAQLEYAAVDVASTMACFLEVVARHADRCGEGAVEAQYALWRAPEGAALRSRGTCWPATAHPALPQPVQRAPRDWVVAAAEELQQGTQAPSDDIVNCELPNDDISIEEMPSEEFAE